jgi:hypothetical protein
MNLSKKSKSKSDMSKNGEYIDREYVGNRYSREYEDL